MPQKECTGENLVNSVDEILNEVERNVSASSGKGLITEDQYNDISLQIENVREKNNRLKCLMAEVPDIKTNPEDVVGEIEV